MRRLNGLSAGNIRCFHNRIHRLPRSQSLSGKVAQKLKHVFLLVRRKAAGLTAAHGLLAKSADYAVTVFEESYVFGCISRTVEHNGNRMDMGGHRFF